MKIEINAPMKVLLKRFKLSNISDNITKNSNIIEQNIFN
jgi:hypothetical protein